MEYVRTLRRRWWILLVATFTGAAFAFVLLPGATTPLSTAPSFAYTSSHTLISDPLARGSAAGAVQWDKMSLLVTKGDVPARIEQRLATVRVPPNLATLAAEDTGGRKKHHSPRTIFFNLGSVRAAPDPATGSLLITASSFDRLFAVKLANVAASELVGYLNDIGSRRYNSQLAGLGLRRASLNSRLASPFLSPDQREAYGKELATLEQSVLDLEDAGPGRADLRTLEPAAPERTVQIASFPAAPKVTKDQRVMIGAGLGLALALAGVLIFELLNARVRDVSGTEHAAKMPLVAEIPAVKMTRAERFRVVTSEDPASLMAEAYRSLRTSILAMWQRHPSVQGTLVPYGAGNGNGNGNGHGNGNGNGNGHGNGNGRSVPPLRALLVTSPGPAEGKSLSAVNLAAAFAETGASVIVIDADFRRPQVDRYFHQGATPNLGDLDANLDASDLEAVLQDSGVPGVRFAASAPPKSSPGNAMAVAKAAITAAKEICDIVLIDSPPLLLANDSADLSTFADATVLLARSGWTRVRAVSAAAELLRRLEARVVGVVLIGAEHGSRGSYYGYYGYYGGYGYDEAMEISLVDRLLPWRRPREDQPRRTAVEVSAPIAEPGPSAADEAPGAGTTDDDPWV